MVFACFLTLAGTLGVAAETISVAAGATKSEEELILDRGAVIYSESCAACHGDKGQGVEDAYPSSLVGDSTIGELADLISDTMPEEDPESCVSEDAAAVAAYVHHAFYSEAAQIRNRPPRVSLARLTAEQLRQSLSDLYTRLDGVSNGDQEHGLSAIYFKGAGWKNENKAIERKDPVIDFDFGMDGPGEGIEGNDFYVHWSGGILAPLSGRYELVIHSSSAFKISFGDDSREFINNNVQSGDQTEFRKTVYLTGGRIYPVKIELIQRKRKNDQPPASMRLAWVPPHGTEHTIPSDNLLSGWNPPAFALQTKLPADDRSYGYERGTAINRDWDESTTAAALEFADIAIDEMWPRYQRKHRKEADENREKLKSFLEDIVQVAFRGELDESTRAIYIDEQVNATPDDSEAIKRVLLLSLKSPRFLYPQLDGDQSSSHQVSNRLALTLFDSLPSDKWLIDRARGGHLKDEEQIRQTATQMISDPRVRTKTLAMLHEWLNISHMADISKDAETFPGFEPALVNDLRLSLDRFLEEVVWSDASDFRQLLQADWVITTDRLAEFYGDSWKPLDGETGILKHSVNDPSHRHGVLTHPLLMSGFSYHQTTSPIHRGVFLIRNMLGRTLRPPNAAFSPLSPDLHPDLTTRERVSLQTSPESCQVCHTKINGLGFTLENFDAVGRFRDTERNKPIDASGVYLSRLGEEVSFENAAELVDYLVRSDDCHRAFVDRAFKHFVKQPIAAYGADRLDQLTQKFKDSGYNVRGLLVEIAVIAATPHQSHSSEDT